MFAVERIGNIISRGVYTVSGPLNPFGGAVDIIVVQQQDGSFKSSPWYVRFGKFQGVLMTKEKVVNISVNEVETNFHMYLDHKGEAYFLRELDGEEGESVFYPSYSGDKRPMKSKSYNYDANQSNLVTQVDVSNGKIVARTSSRGSRFLGLAFGRKSMEENRFQDEEDGIGVVRADSLDYAQIAADLLEVKWSTNLASGRHRKKDKNLQIHGQKQLDSLVDDNMENSLDHLVSHKETGSHDNEMGNSFPFGFQKPEISVGETGVEMSCLRTKHVIVTSTSSESGLEESDELNSEMSRKIDELGVRNADHGENTNGVNSEIPDSAELEACPSKKLDEEQIFNKDVVNVSEKESGADGLQSFVYHDTSESTCTFSGFRNSICQVQDEENVEDEDNMHKFQYSLESVSVPQDFNGDCIPIEEINTSPLDSSEEEQFLFGDLDDFKLSDVKCMESSSSDHEEKENHSSLTPKGIEAVTNSLNLDYESYSSLDKFVQGNSPDDVEDLRQKSRILSSCIKIPRGSKVVGEEVGRTVESLPNLWPRTDDLDTDDHRYSLGHSVDSSSKSSKWILLRKDISNIIKSDTDKEHLLSLAQPTTDDGQILDALKEVLANPAVGDPSTTIPSGGNWRLWPFPFKRSRSMKATQPALDCTGSSDAENGPESTAGMDGEKNVFKPKVNKKKVREITPTSEQLASMNLKEGRNTVTFTFSTAMLGKQQVDARIYLWRWDTHIVISDVDGTITKSDVLGQFMPLVGMDWAQTGVAHLFSAIKENGYQLLFLSARAISQAYHTRQFLFNLKQDGEALPDGPVVISPDGLFPSLFREVIRRAPHEFKIACLEDIKVLFPSDRNPFYAGFGNRDSDEVSYLKVGIPKGKIFIINPKGEVAVNHRIDTKSYTSLHALVDGMFPSMSSSEQEDFNSWNYWKLPPPAIDV